MRISKPLVVPHWVNRTGKEKPSKYEFEKLEVGDLLTIERLEQTCTFRSFYVMAMSAAAKCGFKFKCYEESNGDFQVYRVS